MNKLVLFCLILFSVFVKVPLIIYSEEILQAFYSVIELIRGGISTSRGSKSVDDALPGDEAQAAFNEALRLANEAMKETARLANEAACKAASDKKRQEALIHELIITVVSVSTLILIWIISSKL
jgi:hypothetical protein